jgi:preprotein translocase subunit SecG
MNRFRNHAWAALLLAVVLLAQPMTAAALSDDGTASEELQASGTAKFLDYAMCAVSIAAASTGIGAALAVLSCAKAAHTWWSE